MADSKQLELVRAIADALVTYGSEAYGPDVFTNVYSVDNDNDSGKVIFDYDGQSFVVRADDIRYYE